MACLVRLQTSRNARPPLIPAPRDSFKNISRGGEPGLNTSFGMHRSGNDAANQNERVSSLLAIMHVDVPTTFTTSPVRAPAPTASQCASNAPTGMGNASAKTELGPIRREPACKVVACRVAAAELGAHALKQRIDSNEKIFRW